MKAIIPFSILLLAISGCDSTPKLENWQKERVSECHSKLQPHVEKILAEKLNTKNYSTRWDDGGANVSTRFDLESEAWFYSNMVKTFNLATEYLRWDSLTSDEKKKLDHFMGCDEFFPLEQKRQKYLEDRRKSAAEALTRAERKSDINSGYAQRDEADKVINSAQDSLLKKYEKSATKHLTTTGAGMKVDTFVFANGDTVTCKTKVTNGGKSVDCR